MGYNYRIIEVNNDLFGHYFAAQRLGLFGIRWHNITWPSTNGIDHEFRCHSFEEAKRRLEEYKNRNTVTVLHQE